MSAPLVILGTPLYLEATVCPVSAIITSTCMTRAPVMLAQEPVLNAYTILKAMHVSIANWVTMAMQPVKVVGSAYVTQWAQWIGPVHPLMTVNVTSTLGSAPVCQTL